MSDQPKPTGEWTPEWLRRTVAICWGEHKPDNEIICRLHNAALAAERERCEGLANAVEVLEDKLDVEREKFRVEHEVQLSWKRQCSKLREQLAAALDKSNVRETELICERDYFKGQVQQLRDQLEESRRAHERAEPTGEPFSVCECGHATIDHRRCSDHDECTIRECECDRIRPIYKPTGEALDEYGYPLDWPKCPNCDLPAMDGHVTCGRAECDEGAHR